MAPLQMYDSCTCDVNLLHNHFAESQPTGAHHPDSHHLPWCVFVAAKPTLQEISPSQTHETRIANTDNYYRHCVLHCYGLIYQH